MGRIAWKALPVGRRTFLHGAAALGATSIFMPRLVRGQDGVRMVGRTYTTVDTFDPAHYGGVPEEEPGMCIYNKLIHYTPGREWQTHKQAAESIEQVDPTHVRFTLKPGQTWANGYGEITADDVKYSFERIVDPATESPNKPDWGPLQEVKVEDKYTGMIVLGEPFAPMWNITLPYIVGTIVCKRAWEEAGGRMDGVPTTYAGPYRIKEWRQGETTILEPNPEYTGEDQAAFDELEIVIIEDEETAIVKPLDSILTESFCETLKRSVRLDGSSSSPSTM